MLSLIATNLQMTVENVEFFSLALVRVSTLIFILPFFSIGSIIPNTAKVGVSFFLSLIAFSQLPSAGFVIQSSPIFFFTLVLEQLMIGVIIGVTARFMFHFVVIGGHFIARDIGISMGAVSDPIQDETADEFSVLFLLIFSILFLVKGLHHYFIKVILDSFQFIPIGYFNWEPKQIVQVLCLLSAGALVMGIKLAAPVMITMFLTSLGMGLMSRIMPAMNVWIIAVPIKVVLGVVIMWECFPLMANLFDSNFQQVLEGISYLLRHGSTHG
jgi:flagellar biosynthetic protein FliR